MVVQQQMAAVPQVAQAAQLQAQVQQAQANQQRNPFWNMQGMPPMLAAGLGGNFYPQMAAFAAAQETSSAMVGTAKLGVSKANPESNSSLVVRSSARKFNVSGGALSVAQWCRKTVEENLEWLVKLSKRHFPEEKAILLAYGDGCETLVLLDGHANKMPADFRLVKKIGVGVSMAKTDDKSDETKLASQGVLQPSDSIWEHLRFEQLDTSDKKVEKCLFIHTAITVWSDSVEGRRRVLQVATGVPDKPYHAVNYRPNPMFEQQILSKWKEQGSGQQASVVEENETWITFNPKELILLEKAFDNRMTARDLKTKVDKWTEEDKKACQSIISRANNEFVIAGPPKKRRKKAAPKIAVAKTDDKAEEKKAPVKSPTKRKQPVASEKKEADKKKTPKKEEKKAEADSDDEPISKMKEKADSKTPAKRGSRRSSGSKDSKSTSSKSKTPKTEEKKSRGRPKGSKSKVKDDTSPKRSRSKSRSKK